MSSGALIIAGVRCNSCSRFFAEQDILRITESVTRCRLCQEKHDDALNVLAGGIPKGCAMCGTTFEQLAERCDSRDSAHQTSVFIHWADGTYQCLCRRCDAKYVEQRKDLYAGTPFGHARKL